MDKQAIVYPYDEKEWTTDTGNDLAESQRYHAKEKLLQNVLFIELSMNHLQLFPITSVVHSNIYSTLKLNKWKMVIVLIKKVNPSKRSCWYKSRLFYIYIQRSLWSSVHTISTSYIHREQLSWIFWLKCSCWQSKPTLAEESLSHQKQCEFFVHSKDVPE